MEQSTISLNQFDEAVLQAIHAFPLERQEMLYQFVTTLCDQLAWLKLERDELSNRAA